jgi:hypothetical protein
MGLTGGDQMSDKVYLGDSVYAEIKHDMLILTTDNGYGDTNTICLERDVYENLVKFMGDLDESAAKQNSPIRHCTSDRPRCPTCSSDSVKCTTSPDHRYSILGSPAVYRCLICGYHFNFDDGCTG